MKRIMMMLGLCAGITFTSLQVNAQGKQNNQTAKYNDNSDKNDLNFQKHMHTNLKEQPDNVKQAFASDFPNSGNINWSSEPGIWYVRCDDMNGYQCLTGYRSNGNKLFTARNLKAGEVPPAVASYCATNGETLASAPIVQVEEPGSPYMWRIKTTSGKIVFVDGNGNETSCNINGFATY